MTIKAVAALLSAGAVISLTGCGLSPQNPEAEFVNLVESSMQTNYPDDTLIDAGYATCAAVREFGVERVVYEGFTGGIEADLLASVMYAASKTLCLDIADEVMAF